ncbi:hypothetical protein DPMN_014713 [Dreissena polymorpha]|uniref:Uncharacterized protein n=1 Tax=Dreissena polymorpha TaxID=45954 RepID=A0A9D4N6H8_DREPO|nr:hypothetical protein DPMN_014713 [Dreissena polymorpha]
MPSMMGQVDHLGNMFSHFPACIRFKSKQLPIFLDATSRLQQTSDLKSLKLTPGKGQSLLVVFEDMDYTGN